MKKGLILALFQTIVLLLIQTTGLHVFGIQQWAPNLFIAMLVSASFLYGPIYGTLVGLLGGLYIDLMTGYGIGMCAIPYCIGGFATGTLRDYINYEHYLSSVMLSIGTLLFSSVFAIISLYFSRKIIVISWIQFGQSILVIVSTALFAALFHYMVNRQYTARLNKDEMQSQYIRY